mmetsp:Transcript_41058/g.85479  ORF Transcript_41058/g.85479 Transcript_41058/m.85479 type:complete len:772 (-) Transcript_41058:75-2390(-)
MSSAAVFSSSYSMGGASSDERIQQELAEAERALAATEKQEADALGDHDDNNNSNQLSPYAQLQRLDQTADELRLAKDVTLWIEKHDTADDENDSLFRQAQKYQALGKILCRHSPKSSLYENIHRDEFVPTVEYLQTMLVLELRQELRRVGYPSPEACALLMEQCEDQQESSISAKTTAFVRIASAAEWLHRLQVEQAQVTSHVQGTSPAPFSGVDHVVLELCRPFVERIRYHFVLQVQEQQQQNDRIERLTEWLFDYLRQHVYPTEHDGPWDLIQYGLTPIVRPDLSADFCNEMIRLCQWVFAQRKLFRHAKLVGPNSHPAYLCNSIEQLLQFDDFLATLTGNMSGRVLSFMDIYVAGDDELLHWWMEREREAIFDSLFHGSILKDEQKHESIYHVAPRAELFCSLLRSVKRKATVFSFSGPYLNRVAAPLCMQFLDAVNDSANDLRIIFQRRQLPTAAMLQSNVLEWIELINGTHMSARLLLGDNPQDEQDEMSYNDEAGDEGEEDVAAEMMAGGTRSSAHQDMLRLGHSLERLETACVEDFAAAFVETLLLEKTKMASYLMLCSHVLSSGGDETDTVDEYGNHQTILPDLNPDLADAQHLLETFLHLVDEPPHLVSSMAKLPSSDRNAALYAARALRDRVLTLLAEKFLEVALDWHGTTPEIYQGGAQIFASDVSLLLGESLLPAAAMRLLDVIECMAMDAVPLSAIGDALCGLAGHPPPLSEDVFAVDERVYEEAMSMIRAKNLVWLTLGDFLSILNRRQDLSHIGAF